MSARRYLAVVQDPRGYPAASELREAAPPDGPAEPVIHTVVLADEYEALETALARLREALSGDGPCPTCGEQCEGMQDCAKRVKANCDHNCIPVRRWFRRGYVCVRCDAFFRTEPPRKGGEYGNRPPPRPGGNIYEGWPGTVRGA